MEFGFWILDWGDAKNGIFPFDFFVELGDAYVTFHTNFSFWISDCGFWIEDWKSKTEILFFMVGENKKNALHLRTRRV